MNKLLLVLSLLCTLPLTAMQDKKETLLKQVKSEQVNGYLESAAVGGTVGYTLSNVAIMSVVGGSAVCFPAIAAGAGVGLGARYLYNKYTCPSPKGN